nr:hypothetical protein [Acinetobacter baumannii]
MSLQKITGCLLSIPMMHNVKLVKMTLLTQQVFKTMGVILPREKTP